MHFQVKMAENGRKKISIDTRTRKEVPLKTLKGLEVKERYDWCFESQRTAWKVNVTFLAIIDKESRCAWCIHGVNCIKIAMLGLFSTENGRKRNKEHIYRQGNNKQGTLNFFRS